MRRLILLGAFLAAAALYLHDPLPLQALRNLVFDQYQRWHPRPAGDSVVRVVDIDDRSLQMLGQWPWPRPVVARLVETLHRAGAAVIAFDVIFAEPDRTSPHALLAQWSLPAAAAQALAQLPDHDALLADALRGKPVVLSFSAQQSGTALKMPFKTFGTVAKGSAPDSFVPAFKGAVTPLARLEQAAAGSGAMTFLPDSDGVVRRVPVLVRIGDAVYPSLAAEALRVAQKERNYVVSSSQESGVEQVRIGAHTIPTAVNGEAWVHFAAAAPQRMLPAWSVLAGDLPTGALQGKIVLVGTSAQGLQDLRFSPMGGIIPGVQVHAELLDQVMAGQYLIRPSWAIGMEALAILLGGLLVCAITLRFNAAVAAVLTLSLLAVLNWAAWRAFVDYHLLVDALTGSIGLVIIYLAASLSRHVASEQQQRWVRSAFSRYVSPNLVDHLVSHPGSLQLGARRQQCSFVFTDLVGFTSLMEKSRAEDVVALLNEYLEEMVRIAFRHEGTLDRIVGDSVAVMFSAPIEQNDHAGRALACALEMHRFASAYAAGLQARGIAFGHTRIGVHCGEVVVGNFGGATMFDYRALGDPVNTASRLEHLNQQIGTRVCVSGAIRQATLQGGASMPMRPVGKVLLRGKSLPLDVFEPVLASAAQVQGEDAAYQAAFELMAANDAGALPALEALHLRRPDDGLVAFHVNRLRSGQSGELLVMERK